MYYTPRPRKQIGPDIRVAGVRADARASETAGQLRSFRQSTKSCEATALSKK
jgi:hypothetical protein